MALAVAITRFTLLAVGCALAGCSEADIWLSPFWILPMAAALVAIVTAVLAVGSFRPWAGAMAFGGALLAAAADPMIWMGAVWGTQTVADVVSGTVPASRLFDQQLLLGYLPKMLVVVAFAAAVASYGRLWLVSAGSPPVRMFSPQGASGSLKAYWRARLAYALQPRRILRTLALALVKAVLLIAIAAALFYGFGYLVQAYDLLDESGERVFFTVTILLVPLALPLSIASRHILRLGSPDANGLLDVDARQPTLLLRSFADDETAITPTNVVWQAQRRSLRLEEAIADTLNGHGPLVAIGTPGDRLPPLGAARSYLSDDAWQEAVIGWIREASVIVFVAGHTHWVRWEFDQLKAQDAIGKAVVLIPPATPDDRHRRWQHFRGALAGTPYEAAALSLDAGDVLAIALRQGELLAFTGKGRSQRDYTLALHLALRGVGGLSATQPVHGTSRDGLR